LLAKLHTIKIRREKVSEHRRLYHLLSTGEHIETN
jgi:hypothetical protein